MTDGESPSSILQKAAKKGGLLARLSVFSITSL
ncbi:hypothetical protein N399_19225 [Bacillus licheniformis CG-B52]|nr:hypothetical protein N399_19225 [Bacillus licheniformis CG-B52]KUL12108.1 hypothetical protein LI17339_07835 [Bacillus licheniformis LMG 17339]